jgi:hypothetical protein
MCTDLKGISLMTSIRQTESIGQMVTPAKRDIDGTLTVDTGWFWIPERPTVRLRSAGSIMTDTRENELWYDGPNDSWFSQLCGKSTGWQMFCSCIVTGRYRFTLLLDAETQCIGIPDCVEPDPALIADQQELFLPSGFWPVGKSLSEIHQAVWTCPHCGCPGLSPRGAGSCLYCNLDPDQEGTLPSEFIGAAKSASRKDHR